MHKPWCCLEEVPYCFSRLSVKFQGHTAPQIAEFDPNWKFPDCNSSLNSPMATNWCTKLEVTYKRSPIDFEGHPSNFMVRRLKNIDCDPNWAFPDCNFSLNLPMATKWCTKLEVTWKICPIVFQGHPSSFKVTRLTKTDFHPNWSFPDCNSNLNSPWLRNEA